MGDGGGGHIGVGGGAVHTTVTQSPPLQTANDTEQFINTGN